MCASLNASSTQAGNQSSGPEQNKIVPCLWFDGQAEEVARFYVSLFHDSAIESVSYYGDSTASATMKKGTVLVVWFHLAGQRFMALNGGSNYKISPAVSFVINCDTQAEIDDFWEKLTADGGAPVQCGWLTDKFGVSWQVVPSSLTGMFNNGSPEQIDRMMAEVVKMVKLDKDTLEKAFAG